MSKKVILALVVFGALVGGAFFLTRWKSNPETVRNPLLAEEVQNQKLFKDTDGDNLMDWEEELWKTDLNKVDTDDDEVSDFEEIRTGHDPLVKGPNDLMASSTINTKINPTIESDLSATDKFSRELFAKYAASLQKGGGSYVEDDVEIYNNLLITAVENSTNEDTKIYEEKDFKIIAANNSNIKEYGNILGKIIDDGQQRYPEQESILFDKVSAGESVDSSKFDEAAKRYRYIREEMLKMSVPEGLGGPHSQLVNLLGVIEACVKNMKFINIDPVKSLGWLALYPDSLKFMVAALGDIAVYMKDHDVVFNRSEAGYLLTGGVQ